MPMIKASIKHFRIRAIDMFKKTGIHLYMKAQDMIALQTEETLTVR